MRNSRSNQAATGNRRSDANRVMIWVVGATLGAALAASTASAYDIGAGSGSGRRIEVTRDLNGGGARRIGIDWYDPGQQGGRGRIGVDWFDPERSMGPRKFPVDWSMGLGRRFALPLARIFR
jgi:hypothetical protein